MDFRNSFLAQLLGIKSEPSSVTEPQAASPPPAAPEPEPEGPPPRHILELPAGHTLRKLWYIYSEQRGPQPKPELALEGPDEPLLPEAAAKTEMLRIQMNVNTSANARLALLEQLRKAADGDSSSLPDLDAQVLVLTAKDNLNAWLLIYPPVGAGAEVEKADLDDALDSQNIRAGVNEALLASLPKDPARYFRLVRIARGKPPVHGADGRVVDMFPRTEERKLTVDENNRVDYFNLNFIHNVEQDEVICRILPPTEGVPGWTVQDLSIPAKNGRSASAPLGRNTKLSEDGQALLASVTGHVEFNGRAFQVTPVLDIPGNVDYSVGNINFVGDVCIHGDVCSGFTVRAMGSITVEGVAEACTLEAGRDLILARGVQGDNRAVIRAQRAVFAKYLENTCVYAKLDLEAECLISCEVYCGGTVTVRSGHQSIIGGKVNAAREVSAGTVGSRVGNRTDILLGGQPCEAFDRLLLTKELAELEETLEKTERQPDSPSKLSKLAKLRMHISLSRNKLELLDKEPAADEEEDAPLEACRLKCDTVFPGTVLTIGEARYKFREKTTPCSARLAEGEILLI